MAIQIDYFLSPDDATAAQTANFEDGPRGEDMDVARSTDVDPGIGLGYLAEVLTDEPLDAFLNEDWPRLVSESDDEQKFVLGVNPQIVKLIAKIEKPYGPLIDRWHNKSGDDWQPPVRDLDDFLEQFVPLARQSMDANEPVYCWLWP